MKLKEAEEKQTVCRPVWDCWEHYLWSNLPTIKTCVVLLRRSPSVCEWRLITKRSRRGKMSEAIDREGKKEILAVEVVVRFSSTNRFELCQSLYVNSFNRRWKVTRFTKQNRRIFLQRLWPIEINRTNENKKRSHLIHSLSFIFSFRLLSFSVRLFHSLLLLLD